MGILGTGSKAPARTSTTTVVSAGTSLNGELIVAGNLHVDGHVEGVVHTSQDVSIGLSGVVEGTLTARHVLVAGALKGKVDCEAIHVVGRGCLLGEVLVDDLTVDPEATFVGQSRLRDGPAAPMDGTSAEPAAKSGGAPLALAAAQRMPSNRARTKDLANESVGGEADTLRQEQNVLCVRRD